MNEMMEQCVFPNQDNVAEVTISLVQPQAANPTVENTETMMDATANATTVMVGNLQWCGMIGFGLGLLFVFMHLSHTGVSFFQGLCWMIIFGIFGAVSLTEECFNWPALKALKGGAVISLATIIPFLIILFFSSH